MNILMLTEYFTPFDIGGSEWSTYYLAQGLSKEGLEVTIFTPNYSKAPSLERIDKFKVCRFPFYVKLNSRKNITPFWHTNFLWQITTAYFLIKYCLQNHVDTIHIQGKYFLPAAVVAKFLLRKKIIITLRDYIVLCPLGMCLIKGNKCCNFYQYLNNDFREYLNYYQESKNILSIIIQLIAVIRARLISNFLKFLLNFIDIKVAISDLEKRIYIINGITKIRVISNPFFMKSSKPIKHNNQVIYAGRLTPGKGPDILIRAIPKVIKRYPDTRFTFYGDGILKDELINQSEQLGLNKIVSFCNYLPHQQLLRELKRAMVSVTPSVWPEPFGRIPLESLMLGIPVVVSSRTGVSKYLKNGVWGKITPPTETDLAQGINDVIKNFKNFKSNISRDKTLLEKRWSTEVYKSYIRLYQDLLKN